MSYWKTDPEQLRAMDYAKLYELAEQRGLFDHLEEEDDAPEKEELISEIVKSVAEKQADEEDQNEMQDHFDFLRNNPHGENNDD